MYISFIIIDSKSNSFDTRYLQKFYIYAFVLYTYIPNRTHDVLLLAFNNSLAEYIHHRMYI